MEMTLKPRHGLCIFRRFIVFQPGHYLMLKNPFYFVKSEYFF